MVVISVLVPYSVTEKYRVIFSFNSVNSYFKEVVPRKYKKGL
jgi:hypothetical protein